VPKGPPRTEADGGQLFRYQDYQAVFHSCDYWQYTYISDDYACDPARS